jgi:penicillin-binding protein 2
VQLLQDERSPILNRSVAGAYPPGSTFKPIVAQFALDDGLIDEETVIEDTGKFTVAEQTFFGWNRSGLGEMDVKNAIAQSSNIFLYTLAGGQVEEEGHALDGLGYEKMTGYMRKFEIDRPTGIDVSDEYPGFVPSREWKQEKFDREWYIGDTVQLGIGQGNVLVSPLKLLQINSVIVNGGNLVRPFLMDEVLDQSGNVIKENEPQITNLGFETDHLELAKEGMRMTVNDRKGTARDINYRDMEILGKTGTAQKFPDDPEPHAWFVGFAPYDATKYGVVVLIENGEEGSTSAVPVAGRVFRALREFGYL